MLRMELTIYGNALAQNILNALRASAVVFFLFSGIVACSPEGASSNQSPVYYTPEQVSTLEQELKAASFSCASYSECPENVGLLYVNTDGNHTQPAIGQCTGFLVADNIVATNSHCVPQPMKNQAAQCDSSMMIRFTEVEKKQTIFKCKRMIDFSPGGIMNADYAFFEIAPTGRKPFKIAREGVKDRVPLHVVRVTPLQPNTIYPTASDRGGRIEVSRLCRAGINTLLNLKSASPWAQTGLSLGCDAVPGNSGSPVLNEREEVVGILQSHMLEEWNRLVQNSFKDFGQGMPSQLTPHFLFTNLTCVPDPVTKEYDRARCDSAKNLMFTDCIDLQDPGSEEKARAAAANWNESLPAIFLYQKTTSMKNGTTQAKPICVLPKYEIGTAYDQYVALEGIYGFRHESIRTSGPLGFRLAPKMTIDTDYRVNPQLNFVEGARTEFSVELEKDGGTWRGYYFMSRSLGGIDFSNVKFPLSIKDCTPAEIKTGSFSMGMTEAGKMLTEAEANVMAREQLRERVKPEAKLCR